MFEIFIRFNISEEDDFIKVLSEVIILLLHIVCVSSKIMLLWSKQLFDLEFNSSLLIAVVLKKLHTLFFTVRIFFLILFRSCDIDISLSGFKYLY